MSIFILAAEPSADLHGAALIQKLLEKKPDLKIYAVSGPEMRKFPIEEILPMESFCVMGFIDVILSLPKLLKLFYQVQKFILEKNPDTVLTIDYPGFNLRLQKSLKKQGFKGKKIHYICPTVWAWGKKRIYLMEKALDSLLTILPFEPKCFENTTLTAKYVGHPLIQKIPENSFTERKNILALFPGSRQKEIERNLPLQLEVARRLKKLDPTLKIAISSSLKERFEDAEVCDFSERYNLMKKAKVALAKSGTVTLELALHQTPTVVQYYIRPFDQFLATKIFKINLPYYALPNLLMQDELFPELFGSNLTSDSLFEKVFKLWFEAAENEKIQKKSTILRTILGNLNASDIAADSILH